MLLLVVLLLVACVLVVGFIKLTLASMASPHSPLSALLKLLTNHLQLLLLTLGFDFDWPAVVRSLGSAVQPVTQASERILSLDCFLDASRPLLKIDSPLRRVYVYFLVNFSLPLVLLALCAVFWLLRHRVAPRLARSRMVSSFLILLFLFHPSITSSVFTLF